MNRRDPMRPHPFELPLVWVPISLLALFFAGAVAQGLIPPGASSRLSAAITVGCLFVAGAFLYWFRRRFIPR
jgi:hypothetical protein